MAFSNKFGKAKAAPAPPPPAANDDDSDEVESVEADEDTSARQAAEAEKRRKEAEDAARAKALAEARQQAEQREQEKKAADDAARRKTMEEAQKRREAAEEARRKVEEDKRRKEEYEYEKARQETIARSKKEAAKRAGGFGGGGFGGGGGGGGGGSFAWKKSAAKPQGGAAAPAGQRADPRADRPSHDDCEMGISAMISRTSNGMKEGLQMLGLPIFPLVFIPGQELRLCGHDVREGVNEMIHNWMTDEKEDFFSCLAQLKEITSNPILTQDEMEMMDNPEAWVQMAGPDGKPRFMRKDKNPGAAAAPAKTTAAAQDDESDDEVIDLPGPGSAAPVAAAPAVATPPPKPAPAPVQPVAAPAASAPPQDDFYGLLGVAQDATLHEIRSKFRALVVTEHPEKGGDPKKFQKLNKAYSVLSDQKKRQEYDESRRGGARQKTFVD